MDIKIRPLRLPNFVQLSLPTNPLIPSETEGASLSIASLPAEVIDELCTEFRKNLFDKANKTDPKVKV